MKYRENIKDRTLRDHFLNDMTRANLHRIVLATGSLRGLSSLDIKFEFPITAIAGKNGAGKSTVLALACCAFHNTPNKFKLPKRKNSYYTYSDFFIQHHSEEAPHGLRIQYWIAYNNWRKSERIPDGIAIAMQERKKVKGGKWNDYDTRVNRTVVFLGIERIVPHSERSQSRSYSKAFRDMPRKGWEEKVKDMVGYVLSRSYDDFRYLEYSKYSLPIVKCGKTVYSGFNMGAGENALFEIFSTLYSAGQGSLLVLDEVELGLHSEAQRRFMEKLKDVCLELHSQVICTTHSREIFDCLPHDARFYIENVGGNTRVTQGVSSDFIFSKLSAINGNELDILVEDEVAKSLLLTALPADIRTRVKLIVVGSSTALARQLAATHVRGEDKKILAIFDGDQRPKEKDNLNHARRMAEKPRAEFDAWYAERICYLPGNTWPESWILQKAQETIADLAATLQTEQERLDDIIEFGLAAGKHNEFYEVAHSLGLDQTQCLQYFTSAVCKKFHNDLAEILAAINARLKD